ncbi:MULTISPECIES: amino acid ABC transporter substrate-binding protein [Priestia]|uniref:amino acid ABC transporter substrate-binding protein n=1 Tax=Priestia TaxID=2800373 RepID=UPI001C24CD25|nr:MULTISPECIES: amino acid ABC transporter substrate-binding protein [Priestia]MBU8854974.1 amino acid ABC transporter substrate-binding protein [Bacillus sp. FJAT-26377]MBY0063956.1 amino acid ABC transporter substrate-binding protein [Priestia aryabhattai]MDN3360687.1 amino acid ABC transporter substrate-binding protein [Priestia megaterium]WKU23302.1 amino acid ABC transporter substrate-binding protein [Priestia megaterium]
MKKFAALLSLLLAFTVVLAACGSSSKNEANNGDNKSSQEDLYNKVKKDGVLTIGTEGTYPPFTFHDDKQKLTGFDVELAQEVAKRLGVKAEFKETQWDAMFAGLNSKRFDMIANEVGIREDRKKKYDFSDPYIKSGAVLIVRKDEKNITSFDDLKGKKSAQSLTSNYKDLAQSYGATLVNAKGFAQAVDLITSKRTDATINDKLSFLDYKKKHPNAPVKIADEKNDGSASGFTFRKGNDKLVEEVNKALKDMKKDGTYAKISKKWFGEDVSPK